MGQTLTYGIYLPAEGERNCYEGLAENWTALDGLIGGYSAHAANLTIHVTAADKAKWDAVTAKADDADVLHLTGAETSTGFKQFSNIRLTDSIRAVSLDNQTIDLNSCYSTFAPSGASGNGNIQYYCCNTNGETANIANLPEKVSFFLESVTFRVVTGVAHVKQTLYCYGNKTYVRYYNGTAWTPWNNIRDDLAPSSVSLPNLSAGVDISGYFTPGTTENTYTPTVNGWVSIRGTSSGTSGMYVENSKGFYASANSMVAYTGTDRYVNLYFPVISGESYNIVFKSVNTSIVAKFFPCLGNA